MSTSIPQAQYALIGGSGTWGARFPEDLSLDDVELVEIYREGFATPYGQSAPFKLLRIAGQPVWRVAMHGMTRDDGKPMMAPWLAAKQVTWVLQQAGVQYALVEGSVGGIQNPDAPGEPLPPWSVTITDDYMIFFRPHDEQPFVADRSRTARMRDPFCAHLRAALVQAARQEPKFASVHDHGVYVTTAWGRFETTAEIKAYASLGAHVVGHTLGHEAPLLRKIGVHLASLNIVSNHAEGHDDWVGEGEDAMTEFYTTCPHHVGRVMADALKQVIRTGPGPCACNDYFLTGLGRLPVPGA